MVDYSKWKNIEVSDDEDETHPNVDTPSLFRWRHQARLERMAETQREREEILKGHEESKRKIQEIKKKLKEANNNPEIDLDKLRLELNDVEKQEKIYLEKEEELAKKEKLIPWNVDTISHDGFAKTVINKKEARKQEDLTEEEKEERQREFVKKYEKQVKHFGMMRKWDDSKEYLMQNQYLVCEETANSLVLYCISLEVEEKQELMGHVAHQAIVMQYILELAKQLDVDPRACISSFFSRIKQADKVYLDAFNDELESFKDRVRTRAQIRIEKAMKEAEEEARQERLGPGGLDPVEIFESLPKEMQECFEKRDIAMLQEVISTLEPDVARYHMKRCIDSGLWVADAQSEVADAQREVADAQSEVTDSQSEVADEQSAEETKTDNSTEESSFNK